MFVHCQFKAARRYGPQMYFGAGPPALPKLQHYQTLGSANGYSHTTGTCTVFMTGFIVTATETATTTYYYYYYYYYYY